MMNGRTPITRRPRRAWRRTARTAAATIATAVLALLAAACSGSPSSARSAGSQHAAGSSSSPSAVAYSPCMRSHGVPNWPDPAIGPGGAPFFNVSGAGLSHQYTHSAGFTSKVSECQSQVGGSTGVPVLMG